MDGYAIRFADLPGPWRVVGESAAGRAFAGEARTGDAVRIFTGAPLPPGTDTVLVQEEAAREGDLLRLAGEGPATLGRNVRRRGLDFSEGDLLIRAGERLTPARLALAGTVLVTALVGAFDAVLLLGAPSLIAWALIGALMAPVNAPWSFTPSESVRRIALVLALALAALFVVRGISQVLAMAVYSESPNRAATIMRAARIDPGSYRLRMRAAQSAANRGQCRTAIRHAEAARDQYPDAAAPRAILRRCR